MDIFSAAEKIWNYLNINQGPIKSDILLVLGSDDIRIAHYASELYLKNYAPYLHFSGGQNKFTSQIYKSLSEAESFAAIALKKGIPEKTLRLETVSTNTQENLEFSLAQLKQWGIKHDSIHLIQKPNMLRRVLATATCLFPKVKFSVSTHPIQFVQAPHEFLPEEYLFHELAGDLQRIKLYAEKGFITPQVIPEDVMKAYDLLIERGFTGNLVT